MSETFIRSGPLRLWTEQSGNPEHPAVLLIAGASAQGYTMPDELVDQLVAGGRQVIRFDHRDTGLSSTVHRPYGLAEMAADVVAILDGYELDSAHIVGASMGGTIAQLLAVHEPARVRTLTLLSTSPMSHDPGPVTSRALAGHPADPDKLPPPSARLLQYLADADGTTPGVESDMALFKVLNGDVLPFDEPAARAILERCWARALDPSAAAHHNQVGEHAGPELFAPLSKITAPTMIIHGDQDPTFTLPHAQALATAIPEADLRIVPGMGHTYFSATLPTQLANLILTNTIRG